MSTSNSQSGEAKGMLMGSDCLVRMAAITKTKGEQKKNIALGDSLSGFPAKTGWSLTVNLRTPWLLKAY